MNRGLLAALAAASITSAAVPAFAGNGRPVNEGSRNALTLAVIGDTPYGAAQVEAFPELVRHINADPKVDLVLHVGDIKNGSSRCDDTYFDRIAGYFTTFKDPLVYTPGDNEWTDCHRANNGGYLPTERLARVRETFFEEPGVALGGRRKQMLAQDAFPENTLWMQSQVVFAAVHVVGSNNGLAPWFGGAETEAQKAERLEEVADRTAAALAWIDETFQRARAADAAGVLLSMQADMWDGSDANQTGYAEIKQRIERHAVEFGRPVLLLQGDSHDYLVDHPMPAAPNVTRLVVEGETVEEWLRLTVDPRSSELFSWTRERSAP